MRSTAGRRRTILQFSAKRDIDGRFGTALNEHRWPTIWLTPRRAVAGSFVLDGPVCRLIQNSWALGFSGSGGFRATDEAPDAYDGTYDSAPSTTVLYSTQSNCWLRLGPNARPCTVLRGPNW